METEGVVSDQRAPNAPEAQIRRLDDATPAQWSATESTAARFDLEAPGRIMAVLEILDGVYDGFAVDQLVHACQTATRAERDGADDELVAGALLHDIGMLAGHESHDRLSGEFLRPHVRSEVYEAVRHHQAFASRFSAPAFGTDPDERNRYRNEPWFALAEQLSDAWDAPSFDPDYDTEPLEHFRPVVERVFGVAPTLRSVILNRRART
jgi:predicted HD phosphohydrolase